MKDTYLTTRLTSQGTRLAALFILATSALSPIVASAHAADSSFFGAGTTASIAAIGLPIYPSIEPHSATVVRSTKNDVTTSSVVATVPDAFKRVDAWYASRLDSDFKVFRTEKNGMQFSEYVDGAGPNSKSVMIQAANLNGTYTVAIQLTVTKSH